MDLMLDDLRNNIDVRKEGVVIRRRLQLMLYNIMYRMMFDAKFESQNDPLFIEATKFNSERSRLAQSFDYNYGDFIPLLEAFLERESNAAENGQKRK
ncbi:UNVERIFIED_CONTAM: cytochrome [Sesamum calycinum]|uniref:Cytochrome n=1 Tax=Sesamum calycinum TaxID=2727403 RepID=A0AAW2N2G1_9LAMI